MEWRIKIHRQIDDRWRRDDPNTFSLFMYLLTTSNTEDKEYRWQKILRWETITGYQSLSKKLGMSVRSVRTSLNHLKTTGEVTIKTTNKFSVISVVWFDKYQVQENKPTSKTTSKPTNNWQATDKQLTAPKEYKNIIIQEDNNYSDWIIKKSNNKKNTKVLATPEFGNSDINFLLEKIKIYNNGIVDWTQKEQRQYWKLLLDKLNKIESVQSWKYTGIGILEIILKIIWENQYHSQKIVWPKKIYYELAWLMQICKQEMQKQEKNKIPFIPWI
jgi:hypothetical protein